MIIIYCPSCRRIKIESEVIKEMEQSFKEVEAEEIEVAREQIRQASSQEELDEINQSLELQTRQCLSAVEEFEGEIWVELNDAEWGAIHIFMNSPNLLYIADNYADYPELCPECLFAQKKSEQAQKN